MIPNVASRIKDMISIRNQKMLLLSSALVAIMSFASDLEDEGLQFCSCSANIEMDTTLPLSHPVNRCARQQSAGVSWVSWFTGSSATKQFHYLDLLELLTRVTTSDADNTSNS